MNAAEHFAKAEEHLVLADRAGTGDPMETYHLGVAQVHATLAVAASQMRSLAAAQDAES